jgi:hypothetical protein
MVKPLLKTQADSNKELAPFVKVVESITVKTAGQTMTLQGVATDEAVKGFLALVKVGM